MLKIASLVVILAGLVAFSSIFSGCCNGKICKKTAAIATVATVKSVDEAVNVFVKWAVVEEDKIANEAITKCNGEKVREAYVACTSAYVKPRREPIDRVRLAIKVYGSALDAANGARTKDLVTAAAAVVEAANAIGIYVEGAK